MTSESVSSVPGASPAADPAGPYARLAVVMLIFSPDAERVLLVRPRSCPEVWSPPGGRLEGAESLVQATRRELAEETGLAVDVVAPCYAYLTMHKGERTLAVSMACRLCGLVCCEPRLDPEEAVDWCWCTPEEWEGWAGAGLSTWNATDARRATVAARAVLRAAGSE